MEYPKYGEVTDDIIVFDVVENSNIEQAQEFKKEKIKDRKVGYFAYILGGVLGAGAAVLVDLLIEVLAKLIEVLLK